MLKYLATTTLILLWCLALSLGWAALVYAVVGRDGRARGAESGGRAARGSYAGLIVPALVAAPLAVVLGFRLGVSLLYPVVLFADAGALVRAALPPALVLVLASGLGGSLARQVARETRHWRAKPFALSALATGQSPARLLRRLVLVKALAGAWSRCLPWLFGELVVVEAVFNAPGLGLDAWHAARVQDLAGLAVTVAQLAALYAVCVGAAALTQRRLGRRLESYG